MALSRDKVIARLARELYDLKQKLENIRKLAEGIMDEETKTWDENKEILHAAIDIINICDTGEMYEE